MFTHSDSPRVQSVSPTSFPSAIEKLPQRHQLLPVIPRLQCGVILLTVLLVDDDGRMPMEHQQIIHCQPADSPVAVRKGVDVLKFGVEVCRRDQYVLWLHIPQFLQQLLHLVRCILRSGSDLVRPVS